MATLVTGAIGAVVGFFVGGPSGAAWGWSIGAAVGAVVFAPKGPDVQGPRLNDLKTQTSTYGQPIPRIKGTIRAAGNVIWSTDLVETSHTQGGGKGGGGGSSTTYTYAANFATAICGGPVCGVNRIWANGKVIYDAGANNVTVASNGNFWHDLFAGTYVATGASSNIRIYLGTEDQMPDSLIEAHVGVGLTPAYRGLCYIVFEDFQLENYGNQIPNITAEVIGVGNGSFCSAGDIETFPSLFDEGAIFSYCYNEVAGEIWASTYDSSGGGNYTRITRYDPATKALLGSYTYSIGPFEQINFNSVSGEIWVNDNSFVVSSPTARIDAATGVLLSYHTNNMAYNLRCSPYNGDTYALDGNDYKNLLKLDSATCAVETLYASLSVFIGGMDFDEDGFIYIADVHYLAIIKLNPSTGTWVKLVDPTFDRNTFTGAGISYEGSYYNPQDLAYDPSKNGIWCYAVSRVDATKQKIFLFDKNSGDILQVKSIDYSTYGKLETNYAVIRKQKFFNSADNLFHFFFANGTSSKLVALHVSDLSLCFIKYPIEMGAYQSDVNIDYSIPGYYMFCGHSPINYSFEILPISSSCTSDSIVISTIIEEECALVGLSAGDLDTSLVTDTVLGYMLTKRSSVRSNLEPLANAFSFDVTESDWVLKFVPRTQSSIRTISESDLACYEAETQIPAIVAGTRGQDLDLPSRIDVNFLRKESDYQIGNQFARRETVNSETSITLEWPMVLSDSQALYAAQAQMAESWMARQQGEIYVTRKHIDLDPCDVITIPFGGESRTVIIRKKDESRNGLCKIEFQNYDSSVYSGFGTGDGGLTTSQSGSTIIGNSLGVLLDLPALLDTHNDPGKYWAVCNPIPDFTWKGASLYKSNDSGLSYFLLVGQDLQATIGEATSVLGNGRTDIFDETNTVTVSFLSGTPSSTSREAVFNGANAVAIESGSGWEILQFRTATLVSGTTYTLSGLLRGRRGTEAFTSGHAVGDRVVILTGSGIARVEGSLAEKGQLRKYKHVTSGQAVIDAYETDFTATCRALVPYSPVQLAGGRDGSGNLSLFWRRRTRLGGEWVDGSDVPLSEVTEAYEVEIWDSTFTTLKRTITGLTSPNTTYSAADQTTDFGGTQSTVYVRVYQLSDSVGRGDKLQGSI